MTAINNLVFYIRVVFSMHKEDNSECFKAFIKNYNDDTYSSGKAIGTFVQLTRWQMVGAKALRCVR